MSDLQRIDWVAVVGWIGVPAVAWGIIIYVLGGSDGLGFYLRLIVVLTVISIVGIVIGWVWERIGGSINE